MPANVPDRSPARAVVVLTFAVLLVLAGCATPQQTVVARQATEYPVAGAAELADVPFFPQTDYQCGPAALATILTHAGTPRRPGDVADQVYLPARKGSLQPEMLAATRRAGLLAFALEPDLAALQREVSAGHPVLVLQNLGTGWLARWHYAVVVGYDSLRDEVYLRSGDVRRLAVSTEEFDRTWALAQRWGFLALPPNRIPVTATQASYLDAAIALERSDAAAAETAYRTALDRWPQSLTARIGLGNLAYGRGRFDEAASHFRRALAEHPTSGDAWNNLAQALSALGRPGEAVSAARRAVDLGGPRTGTYLETLRAIDAAEKR